MNRPPSPTTADGDASPGSLGPTLLSLARHAVERTVREGQAPPVPELDPSDPLQQPGATFVTLLAAGRLRGCLGTLEARRPLVEDLWSNAIAAATRDPRFSAVSPRELEGLAVEVSVLGPPEPLDVGSRAEAVSALRPGVDGVVLRWKNHRATFLPQVWQQIPKPETFLAQLAHKAGLKPDFWAPDVALERYCVDKYSEMEGNA